MRRPCVSRASAAEDAEVALARRLGRRDRALDRAARRHVAEDVVKEAALHHRVALERARVRELARAHDSAPRETVKTPRELSTPCRNR